MAKTINDVLNGDNNKGGGSSSTTGTAGGSNTGGGNAGGASNGGGSASPSTNAQTGGGASTNNAASHNTTDVDDPTKAALQVAQEGVSSSSTGTPAATTDTGTPAATTTPSATTIQTTPSTTGTPTTTAVTGDNAGQPASQGGGNVSNQSSESNDLDARIAKTVKEKSSEFTKNSSLPSDKPLSYAEMYRQMNPYAMPTQEQLEAERKKEKRERLFAAIGDGISALSNLYFTNQYAPNMYDSKNSMSSDVDDRWTQLRKEREENRRRYVDGYIKAMQADDLQAVRQQNANVAAEYKKAETERKAKAQEVKNEKEKAYTAWIQERAKGQGEMDEAKIEYYKTKIDCLNRGMDIKEAESEARIAELRARADKEKRQGTSSWVSGSGGRSSSSSGSGSNKYYGTFRGKTYATKADYEKAVEQAANEMGVSTMEDYTTTQYGIKKTSQRKRKFSDIAADVERRDAQRRSQKPAAKPRTSKTTKTTKKSTKTSKPAATRKPTSRNGNWASGLKL